MMFADQFQCDHRCIDDAGDLVVCCAVGTKSIAAVHQSLAGMGDQVAHAFEVIFTLQLYDLVSVVFIEIFHIRDLVLAVLMAHATHDGDLLTVPHHPGETLVGDEHHILHALHAIDH